MVGAATAARPLDGVRVLETATLFAGPIAGAILGDFGADVIKIEHPTKPDPARGHGPAKDGVGLWWKVVGRNKQALTLDLSRGRDVFLRLVEQADVVIENFRPGTLERWQIGPDILQEVNPRLVIARVTGFGQFGPLATSAAFGTLAEAMSGFAAATGEPDGPPTLPPFGLADSIAGLATAYAVSLALLARGDDGPGQVLDVALIEPIMAMLGPQVTWWTQLGYRQPRLGNRTQNNAPRNVYRCSDGAWVAVSTSADTIATRVLRLVGREDLARQGWFATGRGRADHADELDQAVGSWIGQRARDEVLTAFANAGAAAGPVYDVADIVADPQYQALGTITSVPDPELGAVEMQNVMFRMSRTPGNVAFAGRSHGADTDDVLITAGYSPKQVSALRHDGVI